MGSKSVSGLGCRAKNCALQLWFLGTPLSESSVWKCAVNSGSGEPDFEKHCASSFFCYQYWGLQLKVCPKQMLHLNEEGSRGLPPFVTT